MSARQVEPLDDEEFGSTPTTIGHEPMHAVDYVIYSLWVVFWLGWLIAGAHAKRAARSRAGQFVGLRLATLCLVYVAVRFGVLKGHRADVSSPVLQGVGMALFLAGLGLAVWARMHLGRNWGTPMSEKVDAELVTSGPYRYVRNPIYSGIMLAALGTAVAISWYWLIAVALTAAYFIYSAKVEEHIMERLFPSSYPAYRRSTKMLIPFLL